MAINIFMAKDTLKVSSNFSSVRRWSTHCKNVPRKSAVQDATRMLSSQTPVCMQCKMPPECCHHRHLSVCSARCYQNVVITDTCLYAVQDATRMLSSQTPVCMQCKLLPECCHHRHLSVCSARCYQNAVITDTYLYAVQDATKML